MFYAMISSMNLEEEVPILPYTILYAYYMLISIHKAVLFCHEVVHKVCINQS